VAVAPPVPGQPFLAALSPQDADRLRELGVPRRHPAGAALFHEREPGDRVLLLLGGRVKLVTITPDGREVVLAIREPGDLIGEMSALDGADRNATGIALEPVQARAIPTAAFTAFLERTPGAALALARLLAARLRDADRKRAEYLAMDTVGRVCARLVELSERFGVPDPQGVLIDAAITQEDLAGWTGSSREAVIRALRILREEGLIATRRRCITVLDAAGLRERAA
jgi:CRP/FNR family transcriptional regulator, cyclic AMP receptor protein